jgi:hypothetical protein
MNILYHNFYLTTSLNKPVLYFMFVLVFIVLVYNNNDESDLEIDYNSLY